MIRGTSEVLIYKTGEIVQVPLGWEPARAYCISSEAFLELTGHDK